MSVPPVPRCPFIQRILFSPPLSFSAGSLFSSVYAKTPDLHSSFCWHRASESLLQTRRSGACAHGAVRWDCSIHCSRRQRRCFFLTLCPPLIAAELLWDETRSTVQHGWFLRISLAYGLDCAVFDPCIQDRRKMTQTPQVSYTNAVKCARLL